MESLKSYLSVIEPRLLRHINGKSGDFIRRFRAQVYLSEDAFMADICGTKKEKHYYQNLKSKTVKILQALAFISVPRGANSLRKKFYSCQKKFLMGQKFIAEKDQNEGVRLIRQAYLIAKDYHFIHMACEMANILYKHHIYYQPNTKKANMYAREMRQLLDDYLIERKAEDYYLQFISCKTITRQNLALDKALENIHRLGGSSLRYMLYKSILEILKGFSTGDYEAVLKTCRLGVEFFKNKKGVYGSHYQYLHSKMGIAYMATKQYEAAENSLIRAHSYAPKKAYNDYLMQLYRTINALHGGQFQTAYTLYRENSRKCKFEVIRQQFAIIEAYLCFLSHMGYLHLDRKFRLGKYLNENIISRSEKQGDNISIMIAELLIYLARNRGKFIDRIDAIHSYSYRHLRGQDTRRAKHFIKILCALPRSNFSAEALQIRAHKHIDYLQTTPISIGQNVTIIEIIPFPTLFAMILEKLDRRAIAQS